MPNLPSEPKTPISSSKCKSVFLHDWWLTKVESESKLGIKGFVNREKLGTRGMQLLGSASTGKKHGINTIEYGIQVYSSAAIAKRHDSNTLEAVDGTIIRISGCINKWHTLSYGFPPEVCDVFLSGFPFTWEDYASKSCCDKRAHDEIKQSLPVTFDDLPFTRVCDLLAMSQSESRTLNSIIYRDIRKHGEKFVDQSASSIEMVHENAKETEVGDNQDDDVSLSNVRQKITEERYKSSVDLQSEIANVEESEGGSCMLREKQVKELPRGYSLRSLPRRKDS